MGYEYPIAQIDTVMGGPGLNWVAFSPSTRTQRAVSCPVGLSRWLALPMRPSTREPGIIPTPVPWAS